MLPTVSHLRGLQYNNIIHDIVMTMAFSDNLNPNHFIFRAESGTAEYFSFIHIPKDILKTFTLWPSISVFYKDVENKQRSGYNFHEKPNIRSINHYIMTYNVCGTWPQTLNNSTI